MNKEILEEEKLEIRNVRKGNSTEEETDDQVLSAIRDLFIGKTGFG